MAREEPVNSDHRLEVEELQARLREAEETLRAIETGAVDALVVGNNVYTLKGADHSYRALVESMNEGAAILIPDGTVMYANHRLANMLKQPLEKVIGSSIRNHIAPADLSIFNELISTTEARREMRLVGKDGEQISVSMSTSYLNMDGIKGITVVVTDLTEQKRAQEVNARLAAIVQSSSDAIIGKTLDGTITSWNHGAENIYGYSAEEVIGKNITILAPDDRRSEIAQILDKLRLGERIESYETQRVTKDGRRVEISLSISPVRDADGNITGAATIARDITRLKETERALRESERLFRSVFDSSLDALLLADNDQNIVDANPAACELMSMSKEDLLTKKFSDLVAPDQDVDLLWSTFMREHRLRGEIRVVARDGVARDIEYSAVSDVLPGLHLSSVRDISERKRAEEEREWLVHYLRERTKELNCLYQVSSLGQIRGATIEEIVRTVVDLMPPAWQYPEITAARINFLDIDYSTVDYRETPWMQSADIVVDGNVVGKVTVAYLEERPQADEGPFLKEERYLIDSVAQNIASIVERKWAEEELMQSEDKFAKAFQSSPEIMTISDLYTGLYLDVNCAFVEIIGYSREEAIGKTAGELGVWPDIRERDKLISMLQEGKPVRNLELQFRTKSGDKITTLLSAEKIEIAGRECLLTIVTDITERKHIELERERARQALQEVYERERRIAETLQRNFLPDTPVRVCGYRLADTYHAALDESAIGGDVYDMFKLPGGKVGLMIADVSGKGLKAARYGAMVKYMLRAYAYRNEDPATVLSMLNDSVVMDLDIETFITCFFAILDPESRTLLYAGAGHDEPLLISPDGVVQRLAAEGSALGIFSGAEYRSKTLQLKPGEMLFLYTDGVTDARGVEPRMEIEGLEQHLSKNCNRDAPGVVQCVFNEVRKRSGNRLADDVAMIALEVLE